MPGGIVNKEIDKLPFASGSSGNQLEPEFSDAFQQFKTTPTPQTRGALLKNVNPIIDTAIHSYGGPSRGSPVLRSQARKLALEAFDNYDPVRSSLKNHLLSHLRRLNRIGGQEAQIIGMPEQVSMNLKMLDEAENELRMKLARDPSDSEVADYTGLSLKRIGYIRQARPTVATGSIIPDEDGNADMPASTIPGQEGVQSKIWEQMVYHDLTPRDQMIFDYTLGRNGRPKLKVEQIAIKLGVTSGAVSQRTARIQQMLDQQFEATQ